MTNQEIELDVIGQYYSSINTSKQSGVFALVVVLKEPVQSQVLQRAADDLMKRLPFMNGRLKYGFFHYKYEILKDFAKIVTDGEESLFSDYYNKGSRHMIRIVYGEKHFTVKTTHSICDGRGLSKFTKALVVRYFERLGVKVDKGDIIDCNGKFEEEEAEDAPWRIVNNFHKKEGGKFLKKEKKKPFGKEKSQKKEIIYQTKYSKSSPRQILTKNFDANKIKERAKRVDVTVSEFILGHIFCAVAKERDDNGERGKIVGDVPVDCRSFFPSKTLRSFVTSVDIVMPEEKDFTVMVKEMKEQFKKITKESVVEQLCEYQKMYESVRFVPRVIKALYMRIITRAEATEASTGLSNLGVIKLPAEVENRIERMEFPIALEVDFPIFFSSVTIGNTLTLTASFREEGRGIAYEAMNRLESN